MKHFGIAKIQYISWCCIHTCFATTSSDDNAITKERINISKIYKIAVHYLHKNVLEGRYIKVLKDDQEENWISYFVYMLCKSNIFNYRKILSKTMFIFKNLIDVKVTVYIL